jgi:hypothetical protein
VRLPAGHGGGKNSSPELLVDDEEKKSGSAAAFLRRGGATLASGGPAMVRREGSWRRRRRGDDDGARWHGSPGAAQTGDGGVSVRLGQRWGRLQTGEVASDPGVRAVGTARVRRGDGADSEAWSGGLSGRRRAVPTASLRHASGAARGSHAETVRCQARPARHAASDRWDPLVSVFQIKNHPG